MFCSGREPRLATTVMLIAVLSAADDQLTRHEFFVVQFLHCAFGFVRGLHLYKGKTLGPLGLFVRDNLHSHNLPNSVEQLRKIALRGVER